MPIVGLTYDEMGVLVDNGEDYFWPDTSIQVGIELIGKGLKPFCEDRE